MKKRIIILSIITAFIGFGCNTKTENKQNNTQTSAASGDVIHLNDASFKNQVFNYEANKNWKYLGDKPCIIDFYADWCGPCRVMSPRLEEIAKEYAGKLTVYKVDTDKEQNLSRNLGITSLPTILFIPKTGEPRVSVGIMEKESLIKAVNEILLIQ